MSRDWQKDMDMLKETDSWEFEPTFDGVGNIFDDSGRIAKIGISYAGTIFNTFEALKYWLQQYVESEELREKLVKGTSKQLFELERQYAAEKERGDKAEQQIESLEREWRRAKYQLHESKEREQKLRELVTEILGDTSSLDYLNREKTQRLMEGYLSLYPKEETKP
ncbi:hypothetical protein ABER23_07935 [Paenibacillus lautus]|uniref:hypothetical protein n=1 Tax=Paenibacillus lautus TaxID=1401 RepID=UPI003D26930B